MSAALRSVGFLDVLSSTPAESSCRAPCIHARLRRLVTKPGEKCGLASSVPDCPTASPGDSLGLSLLNAPEFENPGREFLRRREQLRQPKDHAQSATEFFSPRLVSLRPTCFIQRAKFADRHLYPFKPNSSFRASASARSCNRTVLFFILYSISAVATRTCTPS